MRISQRDRLLAVFALSLSAIIGALAAVMVAGIDDDQPDSVVSVGTSSSLEATAPGSQVSAPENGSDTALPMASTENVGDQLGVEPEGPSVTSAPSTAAVTSAPSTAAVTSAPSAAPSASEATPSVPPSTPVLSAPGPPDTKGPSFVGPPGVTAAEPVGEGVTVNDRPAVYENSIVLLGDSITFEGKNWDRLLPGYRTVNHGYSLATASQISDVARQVAPAKPRVVTLLAGTNDVSLNLAPAETRKHLVNIIDAFESSSPETAILLHTLPPRTRLVNQTIEHNKMIRQLAAERSLPLVDLYSLFDDGSGAMSNEHTWDGVHLDGPGYDVWSAELRGFLDRNAISAG